MPIRKRKTKTEIQDYDDETVERLENHAGQGTMPSWPWEDPKLKDYQKAYHITLPADLASKLTFLHDKKHMRSVRSMILTAIEQYADKHIPTYTQ